MKTLPKKSAGFTLIEILVALTIVAILAVSVFVALNPAQRLKDAKDTRRASDVDSILTAIHQAVVDNKGSMPTNMPAEDTETQLGSGASGCALSTTHCTIAATACSNLMANVAIDLVPYLASMPIDPVGSAGGADATKTGYSVKRDTNGIITVKACNTDGTVVVSASR